MSKITTISLIKCDVGSLVGHYVVPKKLLESGRNDLEIAKETGLINSFHVFHVGDDLELLLVHENGASNYDVHKLSLNVFKNASEKAASLLGRRKK